MPVKKLESTINVLEAAKQRIRNVFANGCKVYLSFSSGKDSLCMASITYDLIRQGAIDPKQLTVTFVDEEGLYPSMVEAAERWRKNFPVSRCEIPLALFAGETGVGDRPSVSVRKLDHMGAWQGESVDQKAATVCHHVQPVPALPRRNELSDVLHQGVCGRDSNDRIAHG